VSACDLNSPHVSRRTIEQPMSNFSSLCGQVAAAKNIPIARVACRQIAADVDRPHPAVVIGCVQNSSAFVDREIVSAGAIDVKKGDFARR